MNITQNEKIRQSLRVFLSYSPKDKEYAQRLRKILSIYSNIRYIFTAELKDNDTGRWSFAVLHGPDFEHKDVYGIHAHPWRGWRTFEVEITSAAAGRASRIRVFPTSHGGRFTLRNAAIHRVIPSSTIP